LVSGTDAAPPSGSVETGSPSRGSGDASGIVIEVKLDGLPVATYSFESWHDLNLFLVSMVKSMPPSVVGFRLVKGVQVSEL